MKKNPKLIIRILPLIALFITATIPGEEFHSVSYIVKSSIVLLLLLVSIILLIRNRRKKESD